MEFTRPSIVATLLWAFGAVIIGLTIYNMVSWQGWTQNIHDTILISSLLIRHKRNRNRSPNRHAHHEIPDKKENMWLTYVFVQNNLWVNMKVDL